MTVCHVKTLLLISLIGLSCCLPSWAQTDNERSEQSNQNGLNLVNQGQYVQAASLFDQAVKLNPQNGSAWHNLGYALVYANRREEAIRCLRVAASFDDFTASALYNLACVFSLQGDVDTSLTYLNRAFIAGFRDFQLCQSDADLGNIRGDQRFQEYLDEAMKPGDYQQDDVDAVHAQLLREAGEALNDLKRYAQAADVFTRT